MSLPQLFPTKGIAPILTDTSKMKAIEKFLLATLSNFATVFPYIAVVFPALLSLLILDPRGALFSAGAFLNILINVILKILIKQARPTTNPAVCTIFPADENIPEHINYGMPSAHSQTIGLLVGFILAKMYKNDVFQSIPLVTSLILTIIICFFRVKNGCHTIFQILIGYGIGIIMGILYFLLVEKIYNQYEKKETDSICTTSDDDEELQCEKIKDGYVVKKDDDKETFVGQKSSNQSDMEFRKQINHLHNSQGGFPQPNDNFQNGAGLGENNILEGLQNLNISSRGNNGGGSTSLASLQNFN